MKKSKKQLGLRRESITNLQSISLSQVVGGLTTWVNCETYACATRICGDSMTPSCRPT